MTNDTDLAVPGLTKIREWRDMDGYSDDCWPPPPEYVEYRVEGSMRSDVLARVGVATDGPAVVRLIHGWIEGGYSEYTVEHDYEIEVWVDEGRQSQRVYDNSEWSDDRSVAHFLAWVAPAADRKGSA